MGANKNNNLVPTIDSFTPTIGKKGDVVTITGSKFTNATEVAFNGILQTNFTVKDSTCITVKVPANATTGKISVTTQYGTGYSLVDFFIKEINDKIPDPPENNIPISLSIGAGIGIPYGGIGGNAEYHMTDKGSAYIGLGAFPTELNDSSVSIGWNVGGRYYFKHDTGTGSRMRVSAGIGVLGVKETIKNTGYYYMGTYYYSNPGWLPDEYFHYNEKSLLIGPYIGIGWAPNKSSGYKGWDFDLLGMSNGVKASCGYSF